MFSDKAFAFALKVGGELKLHVVTERKLIETGQKLSLELSLIYSTRLTSLTS